MVTLARSEYGLLRPLIRAIADCSDTELQLIVSGAHFDPIFGRTVSEIIADGFPIADQVDVATYHENTTIMADVIGVLVPALARSYSKLNPDLVILLGDRYETLAAAIAAVSVGIPIGHVGGGALTFGAVDDLFRHAISKLSSLHFVEIPSFAQRILQMGEEPSSVHITGALGIDNLKLVPLLSRAEFNQRFGVALNASPILITYHPTTQDQGKSDQFFAEMLGLLAEVSVPLLFTYPNADVGSDAMIKTMEAFVANKPEQRFVVRHLGTAGYFSAMAMALVMVGNSSSGIVEAASFQLPVINIGDRQGGRLAPANVLQCTPEADAFQTQLAQALSNNFRQSLKELVNPYGQGDAAARILKVLRETELKPSLLRKAFVNWSPSCQIAGNG